MWKAIIFTFLLPLILIALDENVHLQELKNKYPYALLTDDFSILNKDDLKINQCIAEPSHFSENNYTFYPYWQCFELKDVKMVCEGRKYSAEDKSRMTMLVITSLKNGELNEFISRRPMKLKECHIFLRDWVRFTKNQKHICISGSLTESSINKTGKKNRVWIFDRYKTKIGCDAYFRGTCVPKESNFESCVLN